jgi:hypothetical protein
MMIDFKSLSACSSLTVPTANKAGCVETPSLADENRGSASRRGYSFSCSTCAAFISSYR